VVETYQVNNPVEKCYNKRVPVHHQAKRGYNSYTNEVVGGLIGAAIGNQLGKKGGGKARDVATIAGAVLGASVARDQKHYKRSKRYNSKHYDRHYHSTSYKSVRHCEVHDSYSTREKIVGYDVAYKYRGNVYHTQTNHHPGDKIRVRVTVDPV